MGMCEVHVSRLSALRQEHFFLLDNVEAQRSDRFLRKEDRDRFILGAALLRIVVARELGSSPRAVAIDRTCQRCEQSHGRPRLIGTSLEASVSHSGDLVGVALTWAGRVGLDLEETKSFDHEPVLDEVCIEAERVFATGPAEFYAYWTRKEAFLKATGEGLFHPMRDVWVTPPHSPPAVVRVGTMPPPPSCMFEVRPHSGYLKTFR